MKFTAPLLTAGAMAQTYNLPATAYTGQQQVQAAQPAMDPMMMMLLLNDDSSSGSSSMKKLLPLMMMNGGMGGGAAGGMDPMMMMLMLDDNKSSSSDSLLPLLMMGGGMGGGAQGGMNPLMMMTLLEDSCTLKDNVKNLAATVTDASKKQLALGEKGSTDAGATLVDLATQTSSFYVDHDYIKCTKNGGGMSDMLPLMMMGGGNMGGMDPMMMMLMMDGNSGGMSDMLPLMMMNQPAADPTNPNAAAAPAMNPLMMMTLLDDDTNTKAGCDKKFKIEYAITAGKAKITDAAAIRTAVESTGTAGLIETTSKWAVDYKKCLAAATSPGTSSSSSLSDSLLPLMMMGGMGGAGGAGQMDPMMMMLMLKD